MGSPAGLNEDFNISASRELTVAEIARIVWEACGATPTTSRSSTCRRFAVDVQRRWPSVEKAAQLLGWQARIDVEDGIAATVRWLRESAPTAAPRGRPRAAASGLLAASGEDAAPDSAAARRPLSRSIGSRR